MLDVSTLAVKVESTGIKETSRELGGLGTTANNTEKRIEKLLQTVSKLMGVQTSATTAARGYMEAMQLTGSSVAGSSAATGTLATATTQLAKAMLQLSTTLSTVHTSTTTSTASIKAHSSAMSDAHSVARGLSGSLGALWVTYGSAIPLAAGLAIGASLKGIVSVGKDVEQTLENIRILGESTTKEVGVMRDTIMDLGKGANGPKDVAEALSTLVLAGLNATEAVKGVGAALDLALMGNVSVEKASSTLVQVGTSLGYTAEGFDRVADVIAKAAAVSMSSVDSISGAFKSASSVGELYGATLTDIGTALAALSNLGIQGTAAGTALKNFYKDLAAGSEKVTQTFKDMKMSIKDLKDADGFFIPIVDVVKKLDAGLSSLTGQDRQDALGKLFGERGVKEGTALIKMLHTVSKEVDEFGNQYANKLEEIADRVDKSYAFATLGAIAMAQTTENQLKSVVNTLQTSFLKAFQEVSPQIGEVARSMKAAFSSSEFINGLKTIAVLIADITKLLVEHAGMIALVAKAYMAFRAVEIAAGILSIAAAFDVATIASKGFWVSLGPIGIAIAALTSAWILYKTAKADATNDKSSVNNLTDQIEAMRKADEKQREWLKNKKAGLSEYQMAVEEEQRKSREAISKGLEDSAASVSAMKREVEQKRALLTANERLQLSMKTANPNANVSSRVEGLIVATERLNEAERIHNKNTAEYDVLNKSLMAGSKEKSKILDAEAKAARVKPTGTNHLSDGSSESATAKQIKEYDDLIKVLHNKMAVEEGQAAVSEKLSWADEKWYEFQKQKIDGTTKLTEKQQLLYEAELQKAVASVRHNIEEKEYTKNIEARASADSKAIEQLEKEVEKRERLVATYGMTKEAIAQLEIAKLKEQLTDKYRLDTYDSETEKLERMIALKTRELTADRALDKMAADKAKIKDPKSHSIEEALKKYSEDAAIQGEAVGQAWASGMKQAEDALIDFVKTGKLNISSLADFIITEMLRSQIKQFLGTGGGTGMGVMGSLAQTFMPSMFGATGAFGPNAGLAASQGLSMVDIAGAFADGGEPPVNQPSLVGERGPEIFVPKQSGTIIPNDQIGGNSFNITSSPTINIDARSDQAQIRQMVQSATAQSNAELVEKLQRAGKIR